MATCEGIVDYLKIDTAANVFEISLYCPFVGTIVGYKTTCDNLAGVEAAVIRLTQDLADQLAAQ